MSTFLKLKQPLRRGALALPLALAAAVATLGINTTSYRQAFDAFTGPGRPNVGTEDTRMACRPAVEPALFVASWDSRNHGGSAHSSTSALSDPSGPPPTMTGSDPVSGFDIHDVWVVVSLAALLLLVHQRLSIDRMRRHHAESLQAQREDLEAEVVRCTQDLTELTRHLHTAHEDESRRLARDLHDELGALLTVAKLNTARLKRSVGRVGDDVRRRLDQLETVLNDGMAMKQRIIENLMPSSLTHLGLAAALDIQAREFSQLTDLRVESDLEPLKLDDGAQMTVFRLVQECLTNVAKHAEASQVHIALDRMDTQTGPKARVRVSDDGHGFDMAHARCSGHGLLGMRYRVEAAGGTWHLRSSPGCGTQIEAHLPMPAPAAKAAAELALQ